MAAQVGSPVRLTAQGADVSATTLFTPLVSGLYRVSVYIQVTTPATSSSTLGAVQITFTDPDSSTAQTINATATSTGNAATTLAQAAVVIKAKAAVAIQVATSGYVTSGATSMAFSLAASCEAM